MVSFDATFLIQFVNFLFLLFVLNLIFFQPIIKIQKERQASIDAARESSDSKHKELVSLRKNYHQKLDAARSKAFELVSAQIDAANKERENQLAQVQSEIDVRLNEAKKELAGQEANLRNTLEADVAPLAELIFGKLMPSEDKKEVGVS